MSEANPNGRRENPELSNLIRELELQIEGVNAGLSKIRGTVARITYASFGTTTPGPSAAWGEGAAAADPSDWQPAPTEVPEPAPVADASLVSPIVSSPSPTFAAETTLPISEPQPEQSAVLWDSVAEGASWPRARSNDVETAAEAPPLASAWHVESAAPEPHVVREADAWSVTEAAPESGFALWGETPADRPSQETEAAAARKAEASFAELSPLVEEREEKPGEVGAIDPSEEMPSTLSSGWPDESAWSQSFDWPALKRDVGPLAGGEEAPPEETRVDVSDIVAQVKAELAAAESAGIEPALDTAITSDTWVPQAAEAPATQADDDAKRDEVSRAVEEMRQQIESGQFETVMRGHGFDDGVKHEAGGAGLSPETAGGKQMSEEDLRTEVRRAVEATREELSTGREEPSHEPEKPAFRLAAPGSIPDWSQVKMEPSGPPVVVMKDVDGRVELASVYETLNELGCGDGAALLNYTPHSVTVGLPISAQFPSREQVADAVEKVFGLTSSVESDGVRITVSIGVNPKKRSVDAA